MFFFFINQAYLYTQAMGYVIISSTNPPNDRPRTDLVRQISTICGTYRSTDPNSTTNPSHVATTSDDNDDRDKAANPSIQVVDVDVDVDVDVVVDRREIIVVTIVVIIIMLSAVPLSPPVWRGIIFIFIFIFIFMFIIFVKWSWSTTTA